MKITATKLDKVSDICISMGQVFFAVFLIEPFVFGDVSWLRIVSGIIFTGASWYASLLAVRD